MTGAVGGGVAVAASVVMVVVMIFNAFPTPPYIPLGRTTATLLGAALMVFLGVTEGEEAYSLIDNNTLAFLFGMMAVKCLLEKHKFSDLLHKLLLWRNPSVAGLIIRVGLISFALSPFITNDGTCVFLTPVAERIAREVYRQDEVKRSNPGEKSNLLPLLLAICTSANIGSSATLTGNPQNVLIASKSGLDYLSFVLIVAPAAIVGIAISFAAMWVYSVWDLFGLNSQNEHKKNDDEKEEEGVDGYLLHKNETKGYTLDKLHQKVGDSGGYQEIMEEDYRKSNRSKKEGNQGEDDEEEAKGVIAKYYGYVVLSSLGVMMLLFLIYGGRDIGWITAIVALTVMGMDAIITGQVPNWVFPKVDWNLIAWFAGIFIVMAGFGKTGITQWMWEHVIGAHAEFDSFFPILKLTITILLLSNIVGNVPVILLVAPDILALDKTQATMAWIILAWVSTIAGNLTLIGSAANIIVAELNTTSEMTFMRYLKFGFPTTLVITSVGLCIIYALAPLVL